MNYSKMTKAQLISELKKVKNSKNSAAEIYFKTLFEKVFNNTTDGIILCEYNADKTIGRIIDVNEITCKRLGYKPDELKKLDLQQLIPEEKRNLMLQKASGFRENKNILFETYYLDKLAKSYPVEVNASYVDINDRAYLLLIVRDISKTRKILEKLRDVVSIAQNLINDNSTAIAIVNQNGIVRDVNDRFCLKSKLSKKDIVDTSVWNYYAESSIEQRKQMFRKCLETSEPVFQEEYNNWIWNEINYFPEFDEDGIVKNIYIFEGNITKRKAIEKLFQNRINFYKILMDTIPSPVYFKDINGKIVGCNIAFEKAFGFPKKELISKTIFDITTKKIAALISRRDKLLFSERSHQTYECSMKYADGNTHKVIIDSALFYNSNGIIDGILSIFNDITELKDAEQKLRLLVHELSDTEQRQNAKISEYMHDQISQLLFIAGMKLMSLKDDMKSILNENALNQIENIYQIINETNEHIHSLTLELRPPILYELGFESALEWLCDQFNKKYNLPVDFLYKHKIAHISESTGSIIFNAVRELLFNIVKHANADKALISLNYEDRVIKITVKDDGKGFDIDDYNKNILKKAGSFGIFNIKERFKALGGDVNITSSSGKGTRIMLLVPVKK